MNGGPAWAWKPGLLLMPYTRHGRPRRYSHIQKVLRGSLMKNCMLGRIDVHIMSYHTKIVHKWQQNLSLLLFL
jgi:hypothetical protein